MLTGTLPELIGQWSNVQKVFITDNMLTGTLPELIGQWSNVQMCFNQ